MCPKKSKILEATIDVSIFRDPKPPKLCRPFCRELIGWRLLDPDQRVAEAALGTR